MPQKKHQKTEAKYRVLLEINNAFITCRDRDSLFDESATAFGSVVSLDREDTMPMVRYFVDEHNTNHGRRVTGIPQPTNRALVRCLWPGNVRELENAIEPAVIVSRGPGLEVGDRDAENLPGMKRIALQSGMENLSIRRLE